MEESDYRHLTEAGLARFREKLGVDIELSRRTSWNEQASRDSIRHFAFGYGDDNPLWCDPDYATGTRWGSIVAPPLFLETAGITPLLASEPRSEAGRGALSRVPSLWVGDRIRHFAPVREGARVWVRQFYSDVSERMAESAQGRSVTSVRRRVFFGEHADVLAIWDTEFRHRESTTRRPGDRDDRAQGRAPEPAYDSELLARIDAGYAAETRSGAAGARGDSCTAGQRLASRLRGPLFESDIVAWLGGCGRFELQPYRMGWQNRQRRPGLFAPNAGGAPESSVRVHWDDDYARTLGAPGAFDYAMLRVAWAVQLVTDWAGDDAIVIAIDDRINRLNHIGDTTELQAEISAVSWVDSSPEVVCSVMCINQRAEPTASVDVRLRMPSEAVPHPDYPAAPSDQGLLPGMPAPVDGPWGHKPASRR